LAAIGGQIAARWGAKRYADNRRPILRGCRDRGSQDDVKDEHDDQDQEYACEFSLWHHNPSGGLPHFDADTTQQAQVALTTLGQSTLLLGRARLL
jgi:hypothetical protein